VAGPIRPFVRKTKIILEIPAKHGSMAARQSSGVRDSKIHKVNAGELSEAAIPRSERYFSELKRGYPVR